MVFFIVDIRFLAHVKFLRKNKSVMRGLTFLAGVPLARLLQ